MKTLIVIVAALLMASPQAEAAKKKKKNAAPPPSTVEIIEKVNNRYQAAVKPEHRAFWDDAVYHTGNMEAYKLLGKAQWREYSDKWARHNNWSGATERDPSKWKYKNYGEKMQYVLFGDWQICFQTYLDLYETNPDAYKIRRTLEVMDYECAQQQNDFWWWADALYMVMPVLTKLYKTTSDTKYLDKLYANFKYADELMWDSIDHLYYRDGKYIYPKHKTESGKKDFWARGDGWVLAGFAKVLADMPRSYRHYGFFRDRYVALAEAVARTQQKEGYWTRSIVDPEQAEGPETSGTALFTFGLLWGMNHGLLDKGTYEPVVDRAWNYLVNTALQPDGTVGFVQPIGEKAIKGQQLTAKNTANFGTGAFLLAACERLRYDDVKSGMKEFELTVRNDERTYRNEVVEIDAATVFGRLGISGGRQFVVVNKALKHEVPYQLTYDGKVLVEASLRPCTESVLIFRKGTPRAAVSTCFARMYPERFDDIAWENDRSAYRLYGPALQRSGERTFGIDAWTKNTPDLVVEQRYFTENDGWRRINALKKGGWNAEAQATRELIDYHFDHGYGLDCYKVGATLGCGAPALMDGDRIVYPYCYKNYRLLDNGPLRTTFSVEYNPTAYKGDTAVVEHRIVSLDKGATFCKCTVWYDGLSSPADIAAGVAIHSEDTESVEIGSNYVQYADPTDNPEGNSLQVYVAALFPNGITETKRVECGRESEGCDGHALGILRGYNNADRYTYYFGSTWSKYDCRSQKEWQLRIDGFLESLHHPLTVVVKD